MHEPDWESLSDIQFVLYNRIVDSLNAALSSIALSDMPEAQNRPSGFWKDRASAKVSNVLNMFTAWSYLIRYKQGESIPERAQRPFHVNTMLTWLGTQLQLAPPPSVPTNPLVHANQETLQEALVLLYSAAFTQGTNVRLEMESGQQGMWFRVRFSRPTPLPDTFDELLATFGDHWRAQDTVFELTTARDFLRLNGSELVLNSPDRQGEFAFFVKTVGKSKGSKTAAPEAVASAKSSETPVLPPVTQMRDLDATPLLTIQDLEATPLLDPDDTPPEPSERPRPKPPTLATLRPWPQKMGVPGPIPGASSAKDDAAAEPDENDPNPHIIETLVGHHTPVVPLKLPETAKPAAPAANDSTEPPQPPQASNTPEPSNDSGDSGTPDDSNPAPRQDHPNAADTPDTPGSSTESGPSARLAPPADAPSSPPESIIVPVKLPKPTPPRSLHTPPASTSNSALTRETQTLRPAADTEPPAADSHDSPAHESKPAPAPESHSRKESS